MPYFQHRFLNPREPRYDWLDAMPKGGCVAQQPYQIPPLPTVWPENVELWGAVWPNGLPEAGASSFDGAVPPVSSVDWTTARGLGATVPSWMHDEHREAFARLAAIEHNAMQLSQELRSHVTKENQYIRSLPDGQSGLGALLPFAEVGGWFDFVKVGVLLAGGLVGGYLVGYLWRELRTPRATNRRKRNRGRRRNARFRAPIPVRRGTVAWALRNEIRRLARAKRIRLSAEEVDAAIDVGAAEYRYLAVPGSSYYRSHSVGDMYRDAAEAGLKSVLSNRRAA